MVNWNLMSFQSFLNGMDQNEMELDETKRNLLDALRFFVGKICEQELKPKVPSHEFVSALTSLVFTLLDTHLPKELIAFSKHAGRKNITDDDMFLFCRKTSLKEYLEEYRKGISVEPPKKQSKKSK